VAQCRRKPLEPLARNRARLELEQDVELGMELEAYLVTSLATLIR